MKNGRPRRLFFMGWMGVLAGFAVAEPVDPRFPAERTVVVVSEWARWLPSRIRQMEAERDRLLEKISALPQHTPKLLSQQLGYHSLFEEPASGGSLSTHQIDIELPRDSILDSIALVPAFNSLESNEGGYAFPKRFRIEVLNEEEDAFETVVDWMEEDFPDPGPYPVFFSGIGRSTTQVRMVVPQRVRESGMAYFALGEIYLFRQRPDGRMGDNMVGWSDTKIKASDSVEIPQKWGLQYLRDDINGFGLPLGDKVIALEDLLIRSEGEDHLSDQVQLMLDLGEEQNIGPIDFWFASPPQMMALSGFGFPKKTKVELSLFPDFSKFRLVDGKVSAERVPCDGLVSIQCWGARARYIRITMEGFEQYKGETILGLGEILVSSNDRVWSINRTITATGIPQKYVDQLPRLVDGHCRQRRILSKGEWIKGLAQRRPLDRRLAEVDREWAEAMEAWRNLKRRFGIGFGGFVFLGLFGGLVLQQRMRKRGVERLKWRIARDLHDEVGSNLGSISLVAERLENDISDAAVRDDLLDLSLLAREASVSLRDVVWVIDKSTIRLPDLVNNLEERARRVLGSIDLIFETSPHYPEQVVALTFKRHLIMFFKEAVHNCARHSGATQVRVEVLVEDEQLCVGIHDNGCGFDSANVSEGWGLDSMQKRAEELGGTMKLDARPGKGTSLVLRMPLSALEGKTDYLYKTSN